MRPLDPLDPPDPPGAGSAIARLLRGAPPAEVAAELARVEAGLAGREADAAALAFARGALALREGALDAAVEHLDRAADAYARLGEPEARDLARCEALLARLRRGPQAAGGEAAAIVVELSAIAGAAASSGAGRVEVVALHYRGAAERLAGDAASAQRTLLAALRRSEPFLDERAQILNSLGTLYVVLGAYGAAEALLEHAVELHRRRGDAIGEAIACGQIGAAALGLGALDRARTFLQRQEWLCSRIGDRFGRARALTFLADVALDLGRADDAAELAAAARDLAATATPPLRLWIAYATRALGRARRDLGDAGAASVLGEAGALFGELGNPLGAALAAWDRVSVETSSGGGAEADWFSPAWALGSLGLPSRVAQLLRERRELDGADLRPDDPRARALAAIAQPAPHLAVQHEVELVYERPDDLAAIASRRTAAHRNLGRLAALTLAAPGLLVAAVVCAGDDAGGGAALPRAAPPQASADVHGAACVADLPGVAVWVWPAATAPAAVARDLAALRAALGGAMRVAVALAPLGRVLCPPFAGDVGAELEAVDAAPLLAAAVALAPGALRLDARLSWPAAAEACVLSAGFVVER